MDIEELRAFSKEEILTWVKNNRDCFSTTRFKISGLLWARYEKTVEKWKDADQNNHYPLSKEELEKYNSLVEEFNSRARDRNEIISEMLEDNRKICKHYEERKKVDALWDKAMAEHNKYLKKSEDERIQRERK